MRGTGTLVNIVSSASTKSEAQVAWFLIQFEFPNLRKSIFPVFLLKQILRVDCISGNLAVTYYIKLLVAGDFAVSNKRSYGKILIQILNRIQTLLIMLCAIL